MSEKKKSAGVNEIFAEAKYHVVVKDLSVRHTMLGIMILPVTVALCYFFY